MRRLWNLAGKAAFYLGWPILWLSMRWTRRTRVIIHTDSEVLLVRGWLSSGRYALPGGGLRPNEPALAGAIREVKEETGLKLESDRMKLLAEGHTKGDGLTFKFIAFTYYLPTWQEPHPRRFELTAATWLPIKTALSLDDITEDTKRLLSSWQGLV